MTDSMLLSARGVTRFFKVSDVSVYALRGVDLDIKKGEMLAIMGVSGSGKSTLLHILGALDRPTSGTIDFLGHDLLSMSEESLDEFRNRRVGFVFQFHHLLPEFTAIENVMIPLLIARGGRREASASAKELLGELGLGNRLHHPPGKMSGGEQQRVAIARALINKPDIILADEPTGNLDSSTSESIYRLLRELNVKLGQTFVIVTHNEKLASSLDRRIAIADGLIEN